MADVIPRVIYGRVHSRESSAQHSDCNRFPLFLGETSATPQSQIMLVFSLNKYDAMQKNNNKYKCEKITILVIKKPKIRENFRIKMT